jgi:hypothetical protein
MNQSEGKSHPFEENLELIEPDFVPYKINKTIKIEILQDLPESVKVHCRFLHKSGWKFYFTDQRRGRCYFKSKVITLPVWAMKKQVTYKTWYICHEMAHAYSGWHAHHGPVFMAKLKEICPKEALIHELGYKPRNAAKAGIGEIDWTDL